MMQEDQEQRFVCRFCDKSFVGGNCLGGHMRRHLDLISAERCDENCNGGLGYEEEVLNNGNKVSVSSEDYLLDGGYGLRVNPKKSWRFSDLENGGKGFRSVRALSVHRRGHLINGRDENAICKECGKSFGSMKAVFGHMRCHSKKDLVSTELYSQLVSPVRKKRSRTWYSRMIPNMESCSDVNASSSTAATEIDEVKGAAICLMMISRGYEGGLVAEVDFFLENDDLEKLRLSKKRKLVDQDSELDGNLCDRYLHSASNGSEILRNSDSKHEFKCKTSDRVFCSNQALGRHQSVHKTSDSCTQLETCSKLTQTTLLSVPVVNSELEKLEGVKNQLENKHGVETRNCNSKKSSYKCSTCFKVFKSGQALGGHKRAHYFGQKESSVNEPCC